MGSALRVLACPCVVVGVFVLFVCSTNVNSFAVEEVPASCDC